MQARRPSHVLADIFMFFYPINSVNIQLIHATVKPPQVEGTVSAMRRMHAMEIE